jgi:hypothetical protein
MRLANGNICSLFYFEGLGLPGRLLSIDKFRCRELCQCDFRAVVLWSLRNLPTN